MDKTAESAKHARMDKLDVLIRELRYARSQIRKTSRSLDIHVQGMLGTVGVMADLYHLGPKTAPQLLEKRSYSRQYLHRLLKMMVAEGVISSQNNPKHQRSMFYTLTEKGLALFQKRRELMIENMVPLSAKLSDDEIDTAINVLRTLTEGYESLIDS